VVSHLARTAVVIAVAALTSTSLLTGCASATAEDSESESLSQGIVTSATAAGLTFTWKIDAKYQRVVMTGTFKGVDGLSRRFRLYQKVGRDEGLVAFLSGRAEFIEKYEVLFTSLHEYPVGSAAASETLADLPYSFLQVDHAGQGESTDGMLGGHIDSYDRYVGDLERALEPFRMIRPGGKVMLFGHSMGGLIATLYAEKHPDQVNALVLSSPMMGIGAPPGVTVDQIQQLAYAYSLPAPYGFGMADRCSAALPPLVLGGIAQCLSNAGCASCFQAPVADPNVIPACAAVGFSSADWAGLRQGWAFLNSPASIGCPIESDLDKAKAGCVFPSASFTGQTTNLPYCEWFSTHRNRGATQTFGWLKASFDALAKARSPGETAKITQPVLMLTTAIDPIAPAADQTAACGALASCSQVVYAPQTDGLFFHELLDEVGRAKPIGKIRQFLLAQAH
jgi:alpha-beta hydrolase superfamily lysophospholipase